MRLEQNRAFVSFVAIVLAVVVVCNSKGQELELSKVVIHGHDRFHVPPEVIEYRSDTPNQLIAWKQALKLCAPVETLASLSTDCVSVLTEYFMDEPVWEYGRLYFYDVRGLRRAISHPLGTRYDNLPYGYDDYASGIIPLWRDIFDGELEHRKETFLRKTREPSCLELRAKGIREDQAEFCAAREMYKYATYLHACTAAIQRQNTLIEPSKSRRFEGLSTYEASLRLIEEEIDDSNRREIARKRIEKGYLHASWVARQCDTESFALLPVEHEPPKIFLERGIYRLNGDDSFLYDVNYSRRIALEIASRAGDEWAVRSSPISPLTRSEFVVDVLKKYPLLAHRHFGFSQLFGYELDQADQRRHQAKAYMLLEEKVGTVAANLEIDGRSLQQEINFLLSGGELKLPRPENEIRKDITERSMTSIEKLDLQRVE